MILAHHHGYELTDRQPRAPACGERVIAHLSPTPLRLPVRIERVWYDITSNGGAMARSCATSVTTFVIVSGSGTPSIDQPDSVAPPSVWKPPSPTPQ